MIFDNKPEFPEFYENGKIYILDQVSNDDEELEKRGETLIERDSMEVNDFKIKTSEGYFALYVR